MPPGIPRRPPTASSADRSVEEAARITGLLHVITVPPDGDGDGGVFSLIFKEIDIVAPHLPIPRMFSKEQAEASFASWYWAFAFSNASFQLLTTLMMMIIVTIIMVMVRIIMMIIVMIMVTTLPSLPSPCKVKAATAMRYSLR